ncbi:MAG: DinB family protein [Pirellulales bacterium]|nr:DinB family protein [Pirellulales bacterium]
MNAHDAIRTAHALSTTVIKTYLDDLTDAELLKRPHPDCNHLAWQLGHLIASSHDLLEAVRPSAAAALPAGFAEAHNKTTIAENDPAKFSSKQEYLKLWDEAEAAVLAALDKLSAEDLDQPSPEHFRSMFPTVGHVFLLIANHGLMHSGQFVPVRRALGKPVKI